MKFSVKFLAALNVEKIIDATDISDALDKAHQLVADGDPVDVGLLKVAKNVYRTYDGEDTIKVMGVAEYV